MNIEQLITPVPTLLPNDTGNKALEIMLENNFPELPVVLDDLYIGLVQEHEILDWSSPHEALNTGEFFGYKPAILGSAHPFEAMRLVQQLNLSVLPVTDPEYKYIGAVTKDSLLKYITANSGIDTPGGIIVLEIPPRDYTLLEIVRICENEDVVIMNLQVHPNEIGMLEVTLKLNRSSLDAVVASFERFKYHVKDVYGENSNDDDITGKYNLLMNYINM